MNRWILNLAVACAAAGLTVGPVARATERAAPPTVVTRYCSGCHGMDGKSQLSYIPRLDGQNADYMKRKILSFRSASLWPVDEMFNGLRVGRGVDKNISPAAKAHMVGVANAVSEKDVDAATRWFAAQKPPRARFSRGNGQVTVIEQGEQLFAKGADAQGLRACQTCHGPDGQGTESAPRLAGQHADYLVGQLLMFRLADDQKSPDMVAVARAVQKDQARAVAAYLQSR